MRPRASLQVLIRPTSCFLSCRQGFGRDALWEEKAYRKDGEVEEGQTNDFPFERMSRSVDEEA